MITEQVNIKHVVKTIILLGVIIDIYSAFNTHIDFGVGPSKSIDPPRIFRYVYGNSEWYQCISK